MHIVNGEVKILIIWQVTILIKTPYKDVVF
jgi:hypothetical protein